MRVHIACTVYEMIMHILYEGDEMRGTDAIKISNEIKETRLRSSVYTVRKRNGNHRESRESSGTRVKLKTETMVETEGEAESRETRCNMA